MELGPRTTLEFYFKNVVEQFMDETFGNCKSLDNFTIIS